MGFIHQRFALRLRETGGDEQHGRGPTETGLEQLILVNHKVLIEDGNLYPLMTGNADELITAPEIVRVGQDGESGCPMLLIAQGNLFGLACLLDPTFRGRLALELGDDATR